MHEPWLRMIIKGWANEKIYYTKTSLNEWGTRDHREGDSHTTAVTSNLGQRLRTPQKITSRRNVRKMQLD